MKKEQENKCLSILLNSKKSYLCMLESKFIRLSFQKKLTKIEKETAFILRSSKIIACSNTGTILLNIQKIDKKITSCLENNIKKIIGITKDNFEFFFINEKDKVKLKHIFLNNKNKILKEDKEIPFIPIEEKYIFTLFKEIIKGS